VLHGEKQPGEGNPGHTEKGRRQIVSLRPFLPEGQPPAVAIGLGRRHLEMPEILGLKVTHYCFDLGGPQSLEPDREHIRLADGTIIDRKQFRPSPKTGEAIVALLDSLPGGTIFCTGRPIARALKIERMEPKDFPSASVWRLVIEDGQIVEHFMLGQASDDVGGKDREV